MAVNIPPHRVRRFGGYVWLPDPASLAGIPDRKVRARALAQVVDEMKRMVADLEDEQLETAIGLLEHDRVAVKAVARWSGWSPSNLYYRIGRRSGTPRKQDVDRVGRRIRWPADRVAS